MTLDLSRLPAPAVVEQLDYEALRAALIADFATRWPDFSALLESEPVVKLVELVAYLQFLNRQRINDAAKAVMLAYATGPDLEQLAALLGVSRLAGETDTALRVRAQLSLEALSTAGPVDSYRYHALSAHPNVRAASVWSPVAGEVRVAVLAAAGDGAASPEILTAVRAALAAEHVRPLCDTVIVQGADVVHYGVQVHVQIQPGPSTAAVLGEAERRVREHVAAAHTLGGQVTRSGLTAAAHAPGVWRATVAAPAADLLCTPAQAPWCDFLELTASVGAVA